MGWPYRFVDLDEAQLHARRRTLDRYGLIAQLSALVPVALFLLYRFVTWAIARVAAGSDRGEYASLPGSPASKRKRLSVIGSWTTVARRVVWWLGDDVVFFGWNWGARDQIVAGAVWSIWLLALCVVETGDDYLHVARRFSTVGVSQFPVQYLLSLKSLNPFAWALRSSHEEVNRWHRVLGRIIYVFLMMHAVLYFNFYYQNNLLLQKMTALVPILGVAIVIALNLLYGTALAFVRRYSYRIFFITHLLAALAMPPAIYFHAHHASLYVWEALGVFLLDIAQRRFSLVIADTQVELIPDTNLIRLTGRIPPSSVARFAKNPGTHIYLSVPAASRPARNPIAAAHLVFEFSFNPFSVAAVDETAGEVTLIARRHNGPMTRAFAEFADARTGANPHVKLAFDGPYGCARRFPNLAGPKFDRVLLVAGGVGATFTHPLYRWIQAENPGARVQMVWVVREAGDAVWSDDVEGGKMGVMDDENMRVFVTGGGGDGVLSPGAGFTDEDGADVELASLHDDPRPTRHVPKRSGSGGGSSRPDLQKIVDDVFRQGLEERVAVLVCGPETMARELRAHVGSWVRRGRSVWWHNESFAW